MKISVKIWRKTSSIKRNDIEFFFLKALVTQIFFCRSMHKLQIIFASQSPLVLREKALNQLKT